MTFLSGIGTVVSIDLRQRVRGVAWYVLLGVVVVLYAIVTIILTIALSVTGATSTGTSGPGIGALVASAIIYFVLMLTSLVAPALSGNAINGDREGGTLATTQVTQIGTAQLVLGKFLASWISSLAFLVVALPFILWGVVLGGTSPASLGISLLVLAALLGVVSAIGVGLSGLLRRPLFSIVLTYLAVAVLSIGTLIGFGLGALALQTPVTAHSRYLDYTSVDANGTPINPQCVDGGSYATTVLRTDLTWWMLAANPYVVLGDAIPITWGAYDQPTDLFGQIKVAVRSVQITPDLSGDNNQCAVLTPSHVNPTGPRQIVDGTAPSWAVGLGIQILLAAAAVAGAIRATRVPAKRLAAGSRIA